MSAIDEALEAAVERVLLRRLPEIAEAVVQALRPDGSQPVALHVYRRVSRAAAHALEGRHPELLGLAVGRGPRGVPLYHVEDLDRWHRACDAGRTATPAQAAALERARASRGASRSGRRPGRPAGPARRRLRAVEGGR